MWKRLLAALCAFSLAAAIAGCTAPAAEQETEQAEQAEQTKTVTLYLPDEQGEAVVPTQTEVSFGGQDEAAALLAALVGEGVLPAEVAVGSLTQEEGNLTLDLNSAFAEVLPSAKRSYGALAPPARKPVGWFFYPFSRFQNIDLDRSFQLVASVISLAPTFFISTSQPHTLGCDVCPPLCGGFFLSQGNIDFDRPFQMAAPRSITGGLGLPASPPS